MISKDMKYTALYWALRFVEKELDIHIKDYYEYKLIINAKKQVVDYGKRIKVIEPKSRSLKRHKDFVVLECVDRLLLKGYKPSDIIIDGRENLPDIRIGKTEIFCFQWGCDYISAIESFLPQKTKNQIIYTSRLVSGLLEYKNCLFVEDDTYEYGFFEDNISLYSVVPSKKKIVAIEQTCDIDDYEICEDELISYRGKSKIVKIPNGIKTIGASVFWDNNYIKKVILPKTLERIGGDSFYYCRNLKLLTIPENVWIMGNNPFAGCPKLKLKNKSKNFVLDNGVLYDKDKKNLIYYPISAKRSFFSVPIGVICLGKHCFFACDNLEKIEIPSSVIRFENNPFSGCTKLKVVNNSSFYKIIDGVIYNKYMTTVVGCLNNTKCKKLVIPDGVSLISRNSFWNCKDIEKIVLPKSIDKIGYNPFAGCEKMLLSSKKNKHYYIDKGIIFSCDKTHICCATNKAIGKEYKLPDSVTHINRGVFSGCINLKRIDLNNVTYIDKSSFTNCFSLTELFIPDNVSYIGEWAFSYCNALKKISINEKCIVDKNAFNECPAKIEWRINNLIIESDNLVAMKEMLSKFKGKIDVMPIDPPYNTKIHYIEYKDFNKEWSHFMEERLKVAYELLSEKGVIFIHIDENEFCNLFLICKKIFGLENVVSMIWKKTNKRFDKNRKEKPLESGIKRIHEFILVCFKNKKNTQLNTILQPTPTKKGIVEKKKPLKTIIDFMGTTSSAKDEISAIFDNKTIFSTPKPVKLIKELIRAGSKKDSIVLDFFAGSGTTGHAVMDLNKEDNGKRKFILITNNENNICKNVTIPRIEIAIKKNKYNETFSTILNENI